MSPFENPVISPMVDGYERYAEPLTAEIVRLASEKFRLDLSGIDVVDVGAGTGAFALAAAAAGAKVRAIDYSPDMVARLEQRFASLPDCEALRMDGQALTFADGSFDLAASFFGIITFPDWERGLREMVRVTRPGGRLIVASWPGADGAGPAAIGVEAARQLFPGVRGGGAGVLGGEAELQTRLENGGCVDVDSVRIETTWGGKPVGETLAMLEEALALTPFYARFDGAERRAMRDPMRSLLVRHEGPDGMVRVPVDAHVALATFRA